MEPDRARQPDRTEQPVTGTSGRGDDGSRDEPNGNSPSRAAVAWWNVDDITVDTATKGFGPGHVGRTVADLVAAGTTIADLPTPLLTLDAAAVEHNIAVMGAFTAAHGVELAPHGKTTMSPALWHRQLAAGAYAITVATAWQLRVAAAAGVRRILHAGAMLDPRDLRAVATLLDADPDSDVLVWADSPEAVALTASGYPRDARPLSVLVDRGGPGARTGARTLDQAVATARAIGAAPHLRLAGVAGWEGSQRPVGATPIPELVAQFCDGLAETYRAADGLGLLDDTAMVTCGGSSYPDIVVDRLGDPPRSRGDDRHQVGLLPDPRRRALCRHLTPRPIPHPGRPASRAAGLGSGRIPSGARPRAAQHG